MLRERQCVRVRLSVSLSLRTSRCTRLRMCTSTLVRMNQSTCIDAYTCIQAVARCGMLAPMHGYRAVSSARIWPHLFDPHRFVYHCLQCAKCPILKKLGARDRSNPRLLCSQYSQASLNALGHDFEGRSIKVH